MPIHKTDAIILNRKDYRETSYLVSMFTPDFGKIHAQVKGAKRKVDKYGSSFSPITYNKVVFYENLKSDLHIVSQADLVEHFPNIDQISRNTLMPAILSSLSARPCRMGRKTEKSLTL